MTEELEHKRCVLFDWGDTLMRDAAEYAGPMAKWPRVEALPHAREALEALRSSGWLTALATNAEDSDECEIWEALRRGGLGDCLDRVYCFRMIGHKKPAAAFFDFIVEDLGLNRAALVMVGDDFEVDVVGANAARPSRGRRAPYRSRRRPRNGVPGHLELPAHRQCMDAFADRRGHS